MTRSSAAIMIPRTPRAVRPMSRTSSSLKRIVCPSLSEEDVLVAEGKLDIDQLVSLVDGDRDDPPPGIGEAEAPSS